MNDKPKCTMNNPCKQTECWFCEALEAQARKLFKEYEAFARQIVKDNMTDEQVIEAWKNLKKKYGVRENIEEIFK